MFAFLEPWRCPRDGKSADRPTLKAGWLSAAPPAGSPEGCENAQSADAGEDVETSATSRSVTPVTPGDCPAHKRHRRPASALTARGSPAKRPSSAPRPWHRRPGRKPERVLYGGESAGCRLIHHARRPLSAMSGSTCDTEDDVKERVVAFGREDADRAGVARMIMVMKRVHDAAQAAKTPAEDCQGGDGDSQPSRPGSRRDSSRRRASCESMFQSCLKTSRKIPPPTFNRRDAPRLSEERPSAQMPGPEDALLADLEVEETLKGKGIADYVTEGSAEARRGSAVVRHIQSKLHKDAKHFHMIYAPHPEVDNVDLYSESKGPYVSAITCPPNAHLATGYDSRTSTPMTVQTDEQRIDIPRPPARPQTPGRYHAEQRGKPVLVPPYRSPTPTEMESLFDQPEKNPPKFNVATIRRWFNSIDTAKRGKISRRQLLFSLIGNQKLLSFFCTADFLKAGKTLQRTRGSDSLAESEKALGLIQGQDGLWYTKEEWENRLYAMRRGLDLLDRIHDEWLTLKNLNTGRRHSLGKEGMDSETRSFVFDEFVYYFKSQDLLAEYVTQPELNWNFKRSPIEAALKGIEQDEDQSAVDTDECATPVERSLSKISCLPSLSSISPIPQAAASPVLGQAPSTPGELVYLNE